jgi:hypothetical protein
MVGLLTGFFGGLVNYIILLLLLYFVHDSYSLLYIMIYLFPFVFVAFANIRLRERYNQGMLSFGQSFRLSVLTGFFASLVLSLMVYFVFTYFLTGILHYRALALESDLIGLQNVKSMEEIRNLKVWIKNMLSPLNLAAYYFILNLILIPIQAVIIAIFVWRKKRFIEV